MQQPFEDWVRRGKVVRIVDADTLDILFELGFGAYIVERVRLARIDAPERFTQEGIDATEFVREQVNLVPNVTVQTGKNPDRQERDRGRRFLAEVWLDTGQNLGDLMIQEGHASIWEPGTGGR